jgi:hypothetical protein
MQAFGMLLLAAATAGDGFGYGEASAGNKHWLRSHVVTSSDANGPPPYTANALAGPGGAGARSGRRFMNTKSQIYFLDPDGMQIGWQNGTGPNGERSYLASQLTVPARYNFNQGFIYRLKLTNIPGRAGKALYPTIEVAPTTPATDAYLAHNAIPVQLTAEDFDQVIDGGNFVTKVIYLPDPKYQELAVSGVETLVSTRLEPGIDPILEADKRGTILLILRVGAIDLEMPGLDGPGSVSGVAAGADLPPGALPPGFTPTPPPAPGTIVLDPAPAAAAPAPAPVYTPTAPAPPIPAPTIPPVPAVAPRGARS